jgi:hypothetical protein
MDAQGIKSVHADPSENKLILKKISTIPPVEMCPSNQLPTITITTMSMHTR